ncbi:MAG: N-acetylmuramoyl-L-alanine amidase [Bacillus sp. (in: Bacteria)]|nr:N-acetylmuramoyl-L-alanine amidase [Bacillus sp. (in: firmicutes)]
MDIIKVVINAGHTKFGKESGAVGKLNESKETRKIAYELMKQLSGSEHEVIPAVFDRHDNNLKAAVDLANENQADLFISIHLNGGPGHGTEIYTWKGKEKPRANKILERMQKLGFTNRGIKDGTHLYVIKNTKCEALLLEICFVANEIDYSLYTTHGVEKIARAIKESL